MDDPRLPECVREAIKAGRIVATLGPSAQLPAGGHAPPAPAAGESEAAFQQRVIDKAREFGWRVAHFRKVRVQRKSGEVYYETPVAADGAGFPDLLLVKGGTLIVAELKVKKNVASPGQVKWLEAFREAGCASGVWRPENWPDIVRTLEGTA